MAGVDDATAVEGGVGPHHERAARRSGAHPGECLGQEARRPPSGVRVATPQPRVHDVARAGNDRVERVIAAHMVVREASPTLLGQPVGLVDRRVHVDRQRRRTRAGPGRPRSGQQLARYPVQLAGVTPAERPQERPQRRGGQHGVAQHHLGVAGPEHVGVVDRVAPSQRRVDQRHRLVAHVGAPRRIPKVDTLIDQLSQAEVLGEGGRQHEPGVGDQTLVVEVHLEPVEAVA